MANSMDIIALEAGESSRVVFSTIAELASAICEEHLDSWSQRMLHDAGIDLEVTGREHLRKNGDYIVMSNHQSRYDIPVLYQALGIPMQMMDTRKIEQIPLMAMSKGKQILPVSIDVTRETLRGSQVTASRRQTANVTIGAPIDPASCVSGIDRLITVVKSAIQRHLPGTTDFVAAETESSVQDSGAVRRQVSRRKGSSRKGIR